MTIEARRISFPRACSDSRAPSEDKSRLLHKSVMSPLWVSDTGNILRTVLPQPKRTWARATAIAASLFSLAIEVSSVPLVLAWTAAAAFMTLPFDASSRLYRVAGVADT